MIGLWRNFSNHEKTDLMLGMLDNDVRSLKMSLAQLQGNINSNKSTISKLDEVEFQVFSQGGEDGIIQYLISKLNLPNKTFVEFGVENYRESNTRYLFMKNQWSGFVIDGSPENVRYLEHDIGGLGELHATSAFITRENINDLS